MINIITKDTTDIVDVNATTGITGKGDGAQFTASVNSGLKIGEKGFVNFTFGFLQRQPTDRSGVYTGAVYDNDRAVDDQMLASRGLTRADFKMKIGEASATVGMAAYNMELPIGDSATFYSFGDLTHRYGKATAFYRFPKDTAQVVPEYYPNGFLPRIDTTIDDVAVVAGVRGEKAGWNYDVSLKHGLNSFRFNVENSNNASMGTASPTTFNAGTLKSSETVGDLDLLRKIDTSAFKSLAFVLGSEFRVENYGIQAGDGASWVNGGATYGNPPKPKIPAPKGSPGFNRATRSTVRAATSASTRDSRARSTKASTWISGGGSKTIATSVARSSARSRPAKSSSTASPCEARAAPVFARPRSRRYGSTTSRHSSSPTPPAHCSLHRCSPVTTRAR